METELLPRLQALAERTDEIRTNVMNHLRGSKQEEPRQANQALHDVVESLRDECPARVKRAAAQLQQYLDAQ